MNLRHRLKLCVTSISLTQIIQGTVKIYKVEKMMFRLQLVCIVCYKIDRQNKAQYEM